MNCHTERVNGSSTSINHRLPTRLARNFLQREIRAKSSSLLSQKDLESSAASSRTRTSQGTVRLHITASMSDVFSVGCCFKVPETTALKKFKESPKKDVLSFFRPPDPIAPQNLSGVPRLTKIGRLPEGQISWEQCKDCQGSFDHQSVERRKEDKTIKHHVNHVCVTLVSTSEKWS